jgi:hypothetical protein
MSAPSASAKFRANSCRDKQRYKDHRQAVIARQSYERKRGTALRAYECDFCGGWHLTRAGVE